MESLWSVSMCKQYWSVWFVSKRTKKRFHCPYTWHILTICRFQRGTYLKYDIRAVCVTPVGGSPTRGGRATINGQDFVKVELFSGAERRSLGPKTDRERKYHHLKHSSQQFTAVHSSSRKNRARYSTTYYIRNNAGRNNTGERRASAVHAQGQRRCLFNPGPTISHADFISAGKDEQASSKK